MIQVTTSHYQTVSEFLLNDIVTIISMNDVLNVVTYQIAPLSLSFELCPLHDASELSIPHSLARAVRSKLHWAEIRILQLAD
jgi:hypothetical protein